MKYEDARRLVHALEQEPEILRPTLHGWLAWSVVKRALLAGMLGKTDTIEAAVSGVRRLRQVAAVAWAAGRGCAQLVGNAARLRRPHILVFSPAHARSMPDEQGRTHRNVFFDDLLLSGRLPLPAIVIETSVTGEHRRPPRGVRPVFGEFLYVLTRILGIVFPKRACIGAARELAPVIARRAAALNEDRVRRLVYQYALRFSVERVLYRWYFRLFPVRCVLALDALNRPGLLAAAREASVPVCDFQHGVIGRYHAAYWIDAGLRPYRAKIPLPTCIMVYGPLWQRLIAECGFWEPDDIVCVGSARMDRFLSTAPVRPKRDAPLLIVFTSQWISRTEALSFWREFLKQEHPFAYQLLIKVHPLEWEGVHLYKELEQEAPGSCEVVFLERDTYDLLRRCDVHVSYQSTVLVESVAMGRPTVSIRGAANPSGFLGSLGMPELADAVIQISTVAELGALVRRLAQEDAYREAVVDRVVRVGSGLYTTGFAEKVSEQVRALVAGVRPPSGQRGPDN